MSAAMQIFSGPLAMIRIFFFMEKPIFTVYF